MATDVFHRTAYAEQMAQQLLQPSPLHMNVRSGVLLSGIRRVGKTTFLRQDLVPALEARGALVMYVLKQLNIDVDHLDPSPTAQQIVLANMAEIEPYIWRGNARCSRCRPLARACCSASRG